MEHTAQICLCAGAEQHSQRSLQRKPEMLLGPTLAVAFLVYETNRY